MNLKTYLLAILLAAMCAASISFKVVYGERVVLPQIARNLWRVKIVMNFKGKGTRAKTRLTLPKSTERQKIYNEHFENNELEFYIRDRKLTGNRIGYWKSEMLDGARSVHYTFSAQLETKSYRIPASLEIPKSHPPELAKWLDASAFIQSKDPVILKKLKKIVGRERKALPTVKKIYDYVRGEVRYRSEKGSKNARETLKQLIADCGGQARLFAALNRAAGIPSRIVGGIIIAEGMKNITHVWVESYIDGKWVPFDVSNGNFAVIPDHYLELYRGDYALIKHLGLADFQYFFSISTERMPPVDNPWSLYILPVHFQNLIKVLLLIPVGALVVAFFRCVIGVQTFGTFAPILLALAFREISFSVGLLCLSLTILMGWALRKVLDHLKILVIPRLSIVVTMVVIFTLTMMIAGFHFGLQRVLYISLFPMVIITWMVERFSVLQIEDGTPQAVKASLGTLAVAAAAYYLMSVKALRAYLFSFPELLLVIMALLLLLGRYTGLRLTELWRFRELKRERTNP